MPRRLGLIACLLVATASMGMAFQADARPLSPPWSPATPFSSETATVTIDGHSVDAEIADTGELRERGLSYRDDLGRDDGMLFVYRTASPRSFWMFEMRFCLDIIWIADGTVIGAAENACPAAAPGDDIPTFRSPEPAQYVLEVNAGWMADHDVRSGADVVIEVPPSVETGEQPD